MKRQCRIEKNLPRYLGCLLPCSMMEIVRQKLRGGFKQNGTNGRISLVYVKVLFKEGNVRGNDKTNTLYEKDGERRIGRNENVALVPGTNKERKNEQIITSG